MVNSQHWPATNILRKSDLIKHLLNSRVCLTVDLCKCQIHCDIVQLLQQFSVRCGQVNYSAMSNTCDPFKIRMIT